MVFYPYGSVVALAAALAFLVMARSRAGRALKPGSLSWFAMLSVPLALLGGRLGWCLCSLGWVLQQGWGFFFQFTRGGFMLYGAMAGVAVSAFLASRGDGQEGKKILDAAAAPAAGVIAAGRLAEALVGQGFGRSILDWFDPWQEMSYVAWENPEILFRFPFAVQDYYGDWNFAVFLPEALTALAIAVILFRAKDRRPGGITSLFLLLYAAGQILWESMRQDAVLRWGFVRVSQLLSALLILALLWVCYFPRRGSGNEQKAPSFIYRTIALLLCAGVITTMEFALEQKIGFLLWMRMDVCYVVMALACAMMVAIVLPCWRRKYEVIS